MSEESGVSQSGDSPEITDEMVQRLTRFLQSEWAGPYYASVRNYVRDGATGEEREQGIREMQAADREAEAEAQRMAREALRAAFGHA